MDKRRGWRGRVWALFCAMAVVTAPGLAGAQAPAASPPDARGVLRGMFEFLAMAKHFSVTAKGSYDAVQASGQKIEWNEVRTITISRPDRLRMEGERSNGARSLVVFDGKEISTFDESGQVYAQAPQPGGVDESLVYFVRDLGMRLPLAALFISRAPAEMDRRVKSVEYVEKTGIFGALAYHIAGRTNTGVDFQLWIADGDRPVPLRAVLTYPTAPGQPQFRAEFSSWNLAADPPDSFFTFTPPADATRIPFLIALQQVPPGKARASAKKGGKQ